MITYTWSGGLAKDWLLNAQSLHTYGIGSGRILLVAVAILAARTDDEKRRL